MLFCDQGTLARRTIVFMDRVCKKKKKVQSLSQSDKLKTKSNLFYLFLYYGETQRATVARKHCNLTPNLCTDVYKKKHTRTTFWVLVQTQEGHSADVLAKSSGVKVRGGLFFFLIIVVLFLLLGYWIIDESRPPASPNAINAPKLQRNY